MGMLQGAPHPPTNGLQRFVTVGNLACCLGDQRLCAQMKSCFCLALTKDETLSSERIALRRYLRLLMYGTTGTTYQLVYVVHMNYILQLY